MPTGSWRTRSGGGPISCAHRPRQGGGCVRQITCRLGGHALKLEAGHVACPRKGVAQLLAEGEPAWTSQPLLAQARLAVFEDDAGADPIATLQVQLGGV